MENLNKEIIHTIKIRDKVIHGILDEDTLNFSAIGMEKYGAYSTTMNLEGLEYKVLKETIIEF